VLLPVTPVVPLFLVFISPPADLFSAWALTQRSLNPPTPFVSSEMFAPVSIHPDTGRLMRYAFYMSESTHHAFLLGSSSLSSLPPRRCPRFLPTAKIAALSQITWIFHPIFHRATPLFQRKPLVSEFSSPPPFLLKTVPSPLQSRPEMRPPGFASSPFKIAFSFDVVSATSPRSGPLLFFQNDPHPDLSFTSKLRSVE